MTITGFSHVNINSVDIAKSLPFYADVLGVNVTKVFPERSDTGRLVGLAPPHTNLVATLAPPGRGRPGIELIEWRLPDTPHSEPAALDNDVAGIVELIFTSTDPAGVRTRAAAAGWLTRDVDGGVQIGGPEGWVKVVDGPDEALVGAVVNVVNLDESVTCYQHSLGLDIVDRSDRSAVVSAPTPTEPFLITLRQRGAGASPPALQRRADTPGLLRLAFFDDDVDGSYARAVEVGVRSITPGDYFDFGSLRAHAALWFDPDAVLIEVLKFQKIAPSTP